MKADGRKICVFSELFPAALVGVASGGELTSEPDAKLLLLKIPVQEGATLLSALPTLSSLSSMWQAVKSNQYRLSMLDITIIATAGPMEDLKAVEVERRKAQQIQVAMRLLFCTDGFVRPSYY